MEITIKHQTEFTSHTFDVVDPNKLASVEVWVICTEMNVQAILVNGKYYECKKINSIFEETKIRGFSSLN